MRRVTRQDRRRADHHEAEVRLPDPKPEPRTMPITSIEVQVRHGGQWLPAELATDSSDRAPVVVVAGTKTPLGPEDVLYIRADEHSDVLDAAEQAGFLVLRGS